MIPAIYQHHNEIIEICEQNRVRLLHLFGSATVETQNEEVDDLDFVVDFFPTLGPIEFGDNYFSLLYALENLFHKKIDLLTYRTLRNPILIEEIDKNKVELYAS